MEDALSSLTDGGHFYWGRFNSRYSHRYYCQYTGPPLRNDGLWIGDTIALLFVDVILVSLIIAFVPCKFQFHILPSLSNSFQSRSLCNVRLLINFRYEDRLGRLHVTCYRISWWRTRLPKPQGWHWSSRLPCWLSLHLLCFLVSYRRTLLRSLIFYFIIQNAFTECANL